MRQEHIEQLRASGISDRTISILERRGFLKSGAKGLEFHYFNASGKPDSFARIRLDRPTKGRKYTQPKGSGIRVYAPPSKVDDVLLIVEGEKKALAAWERLRDTVRVVGLGGVWNWPRKNGRCTEVVSELAKLCSKKPRVFICFDSDVVTNGEVLRAEMLLAAALKKHARSVKIVELPPEHKGLDDWLVEWGDEWRDRLRDLFRRAVPARVEYQYEGVYDKVYSYPQMLEGRFPVPRRLWGEGRMILCGEGLLMFLCGRPGVGKTYFMLQLAASMAMGSYFLGLPTQESTVLMLQGEVPPGLFKHRLNDVKELMGDPGDRLLFYNWSFPVVKSDYKAQLLADRYTYGEEKIDRLLQEHHPQVLIVDPLQLYADVVENSNDQNREMIALFKKIARRRNMGVILVDHSSKDDSDGRGLYRLRGASAKSDLADTILHLAYNARGDHWELQFDKIRYGFTAFMDPWRLKREGPFFEREVSGDVGD